MKIENNLFKILKEEIRVNEIDDYFDGLNEEEVKFVKEWKGEKGKMYFCYLGMGGIDVWEVGEKYDNFDDVKKNVDGWEDFNEEVIFENVLFIDDGFYVKVS
jgi:hypothetical protein